MRLVPCAAIAFALGCSPVATNVSPPHDAAAPDAGDARDAGPTCTLGGKSTLAPATIACGQGATGRVVLDGDDVYWAVQAPGAVVMHAPQVGGAATAVTTAKSPAVGLVVVKPWAYFTLFASGQVARAPLAGGRVEVVADGLDRPAFLATDGASLYVTAGHDHAGAVLQIPLSAPKPVVLIDGLSRPRGVAISGGFVYWTDFLDGTLMRAPAHLDASVADGGVRTAARLAAGLSGPSDLALADGHAYLADQRGMIVRVPLAGGDPQIVAAAHGTPYGVATDASFVYWTTLLDGGVFRAPLAGGDVTTLAIGQSDAHFLAVGADTVFWAAWGDGGAIRRVSKLARVVVDAGASD
ncbi:MAG TPA: hypothetical protein VHJ20_02255 [Polyangia bacterium]|nr:hypothetical protein [Polyangia bacterium]